MKERVVPLTPTCPRCQQSLPYKGAIHPVQNGCFLQEGSIPNNSVESIVCKAYAAYPTLYGRSAWARWRIFDQLFFTIEGGYVWHKGELVEVSPEFDEVIWRTFEEEEEDIVMGTYRSEGEFYQRHKDVVEKQREEFRQELRKEWELLHQKPNYWTPLTDGANIFSLPSESISLPWVYAACDATRMFLQGSSKGQSLKRIVQLVRLQTPLFQWAHRPLPDDDEPCMTYDL